MTKEEYLAMCATRYEELEMLKEKDSFYDYEVGLERILNDSDRQYLESVLNGKSVTENRRKKNTNSLWRSYTPRGQVLCIRILDWLRRAKGCFAIARNDALPVVIANREVRTMKQSMCTNPAVQGIIFCFVPSRLRGKWIFFVHLPKPFSKT
jgi:hypothetical protein